MTAVADVANLAGATLVLLGAFLCFAASVGLVRFPDVLSRMHAATKPQTLGLLLVVAGVALTLRSWAAFGTLVLVAMLQLATAPVAAHLVARTVYRSNQVRRDLLVTDELADELAEAGFRLAESSDDEPEAGDDIERPVDEGDSARPGPMG